MTATPADEQGTRSRTLTKAYGQATAALRSENKERFEELYVKAAADLGVEYTPRLNAQQKAEALVREQLQKYPDLRERVLAEHS